MFSSLALIVANVVNPGKWSFTVNFCVWGLGGGLFVWYPFACPFGMIIVEARTHAFRLQSFSIMLDDLVGHGRELAEDEESLEKWGMESYFEQSGLTSKSGMEGSVHSSLLLVEDVEVLFWGIISDMNRVTKKYGPDYSMK